MVIALPEYVVAFENEAYVRDRSVNVKGEFFVVKDVILPVRYVQSNEDEVVAHLREKVTELEGVGEIALSDGRRAVFGKRSALEKAILGLPDKIRRDIRTGDEACVKFIRNNTSAPALGEGERSNEYLNIKYGVLPSGLVDENKIAGNVDSSYWYFAALSDDDVCKAGFGTRFNINILLDCGKLPDKKDMDVLLRHGTYSSITFDVNSSYPLDRMQEIIDAVYQGMLRAEDVKQLKDVSKGVLEESSLKPIIALHKMVRERIEETENAMRKAPKNRFSSGHNGTS